MKGLPKITIPIFLVFLTLICVPGLMAQRQMENLDRGVIAVRCPGDSVYVGWRLLGTEPDDIAFNLYRRSGNDKPVKLNQTLIKESTNCQVGKQNFTVDNFYFVKAILGGVEAGGKQTFYHKSKCSGSAIHQYSA